MSRLLFKNCRFVTSAVRREQYPILKDDRGVQFPEIAVAGRSNVGKSSLLNHLFGVKNLVKTSSTPGKTQLLNFFSVNEQVLFVDLPGYGFANVPTSVRKKWGPMVQTYVDGRAPLKAVLLLLDIRRTPNEEDRQMAQWTLDADLPLILVLTKADKLKRGQRAAQGQKILSTLALGQTPAIMYSVTKNIGRKELTAILGRSLYPPDQESP